jgi:GAF domain-containing protein
MQTLEMPVNEHERINALKKYRLLDTPPDGSFERLTQLAATLFNVPIAIISLVDSDRIWFKSHYGLPISQIDREPGLCASAILSNNTYVVEDAKKDPRTLANPLVAGDFGLRFYAAAPLQTEENYNLGTLCIIDKQPRTFTKEQQSVLKQLAAIVMDEMEMRLVVRDTAQTIQHISSDISAHLNDAIKELKTAPEKESGSQLTDYLEATQLYISNIENRLENL